MDAPDDRIAERARMIEEQLVHRLAENSLGASPFRIQSPKVLQAIRDVPRHWFVPETGQAAAYEDHPLPIGHGQTISQPFIVAVMTELLDPQPDWKILEVGTGSGYQTAILTQFTPDVFTIEIVEPLQKQALARLQKFGLGVDRVLHRDGSLGLTSEAPFDGIIVTASAAEIPEPVLDQLKPGGRMVIPVGSVAALQHLVVADKEMSGKIRQRSVLPVQFVPLTGGPSRD